MTTQNVDKDSESHTDKNTDNEDFNSNITFTKDVTRSVNSVGATEAMESTLATHVGQMAELSTMAIAQALRHADQLHTVQMRMLQDGASNSNMMNQGALSIAFRGAEENVEEG